MHEPWPTDLASADAAASPGEVALPLTLKGLVACLVLILYGGVMAAYVLAERQTRFRQLAELDERKTVEESLKHAGLAVSSALLTIRQGHSQEDALDHARDTAPFALEAVERTLGAWRVRMPAVFGQHQQAGRHLSALLAQPSRAGFLELREALEALGREVEIENTRESERRGALAREFGEHGDRITLNALALGLGGMLVFGGVTALFFGRLAADLRTLGVRAKAIVAGYRGAPLEVRRRDEVGALMRDVNQLAADLALRERELALARELRAHREKMAALGAMARNISHEIGNPLATISALAQEAVAQQGRGGRDAWRADAMMQQAQRIAEITRQIADFSGPRADAPEPVDAGAMLGLVCDFMRFDPRFRTTRIEVLVAPGLPVLEVVPDQLSEVLMNLVQSAVPAEGDAGPATVVVEAAAAPGGVAIRVPAGGWPGDTARRERTRALVEGMNGRISDAAEGVIEVMLPAARLATR